jgi:hypothetical protein
MKGFIVTAVLLFTLLAVGEVKCIVKAINCNWKPIGKAEVIYTASAFTGAGCIVGWFNIEDE